MNKTAKKIWNIFTTLIVTVVVILALLLAGARLFGLKVYTVLSASMEPTYQTGSVIYVKEVDPFTLKAGDPITFMLNEDTVATHRIVEVVPDEEDSTVLRFITKGDNNENIDSASVHIKNIIGKPIFSIPYLGFVSDFIQKPNGRMVAIAAALLVVVLVFIPDMFKEKPKKENEDEKTEPEQ